MPLQFIPIAFFILLGVFFLQKAIRPNASRSMGWGRGGGRVPVSRVGYAVWGCTFFVIAGVLIKRNDIPPMLVIALGICVLAIVGVGFRDAYLHRRRKVSTSKKGKTSGSGLHS